MSYIIHAYVIHHTSYVIHHTSYIIYIYIFDDDEEDDDDTDNYDDSTSHLYGIDIRD